MSEVEATTVGSNLERQDTTASNVSLMEEGGDSTAKQPEEPEGESKDDSCSTVVDEVLSLFSGIHETFECEQEKREVQKKIMYVVGLTA